MNQKEFLNDLVEERITMLLSKQPEEVTERGRKTADMIDSFASCLDTHMKEQFEQMLNRIILEDSEESRYLYLSGVKDGCRITRWLLKA